MECFQFSFNSDKHFPRYREFVEVAHGGEEMKKKKSMGKHKSGGAEEKRRRMLTEKIGRMFKMIWKVSWEKRRAIWKKLH